MNSSKSSSKNNNNTTTNLLDSSNALSALDNFNQQAQSPQIPNEHSSCNSNNNNSSNPSCGSSSESQQNIGLNTSRFQLNAKEVTIAITGFQFLPRSVYVHEGTRVHWIVKRNESADKVTPSSAVYAHSGPRFFVVSVPALDEESDPIHEVNDDQTGTTFSIVFSRVGNFEVICSNHTRMKSEIIVVEQSITLQSLQDKEESSKQTQSKSAIMQQVDGFKYPNASTTFIEKKNQQPNQWQPENNSDSMKQNQFSLRSTEETQINSKIEAAPVAVSSYQAQLAKVNEEKRRILIRDEMKEGDDEKKVANDFIQELKEQIKAEKGKIPVRKPAHYLPLYKDDDKKDDDDEEPAMLPESLVAALVCKKFLNGEGSKESKMELVNPTLNSPESLMLGGNAAAHSKKSLNNLTVVVALKKAIRKRSSSSSSGGSSQRRRRSRLVTDGYESDFYSNNAARLQTKNAQLQDDQCETQSSRSAVRIPVLRKHAAAAAAAAAANVLSAKKAKVNNRGAVVASTQSTVAVLPGENDSLNVIDYKLAQRKQNGFNAKGGLLHGSSKSCLQTKKPLQLQPQSEQKLKVNNNFNGDEDDLDQDHDDEGKNTDIGDEEEEEQQEENNDEGDEDYNEECENDSDNEGEVEKEEAEEQDYEEVYEDYNDDDGEGLVQVEGEDFYELAYDDGDEDVLDQHEAEDDNAGTLCAEENDLEGSRTSRRSSCSEDQDIYDLTGNENVRDGGAQACSESDQDERVDSIQMKHAYEVGCKSDRIEGFNEYDCNQVISEEDTMNSSAQTSKDNSVHSHSRGLRSRRQNINSIIHSSAVVSAAVSTCGSEKKQQSSNKGGSADGFANEQHSELEQKSTMKSSLRKQLAKQPVTQKAQPKRSSPVTQFQQLVVTKSSAGNSMIASNSAAHVSTTKKKAAVHPPPLKNPSIYSGKQFSISQHKSGVVVSALSSTTSSPTKAATSVVPSKNVRINSSTSSSMTTTATTITSTSISSTAVASSMRGTASSTTTSVRGIQSNKCMVGSTGSTHATHTTSSAGGSSSSQTGGGGYKGGKMKPSMGKSNGSSSMKSPAQSILTTAESSKYSDTTKNLSQKGDFELETSDIQEKECGGVLLYRLRHSNKRRASTDQTIQESRCSHGHDDSDTRSIKSLKSQPISLIGTLNLAAAAAAASVGAAAEQQVKGGQNDIGSKIATKSEIEDSEQDGSLKIYEYDRFVAASQSIDGSHKEGETTRIGLKEFCRIQPRDSVAIALKGSVSSNSSSTSNNQSSNSYKMNEIERNACASFTSNIMGILEMRYETECWLDESLEDY